MARLSAFKGLDESLVNGLEKNGLKFGLGAHNSLLQMANVGYGSATAWGAGIGAAYGAADGLFSYDGSFFGGAFHGGIMGAAGGAGLRFAAETYAKGAVAGFSPYKGQSAFKSAALDADGKYFSTWGRNRAGEKNTEIGAFNLFDNIGAGW